MIRRSTYQLLFVRVLDMAVIGGSALALSRADAAAQCHPSDHEVGEDVRGGLSR